MAARLHSFLLVCASAAWLATPLAPARAQAPLPVDLELVLAVDVSFSMSPTEQRIQRQGYAQAVVHPLILGAIASGPHGRIALTYVEWGGAPFQVVPWTLIDGADAAERFADALLALPYRSISFTSITRALVFSGGLFGGDEYVGARRVVDVSGDGPNNDGAPVTLARDKLVGAGIEINGLAIVLPSRAARTVDDLEEYYRNCVIGGPGAFVLKVDSPGEFAPTIRRKMYLEIAYPKLTRRPGGAPHDASAGARHAAPVLRAQYPARSCFIGVEEQPEAD